MEEIEGGGGGVQPERSDACNDNAASLTWIALHQLLIAAPDILVVCLSNVSLFLSGGPRPTHQIRGNCWGQGLTQDIATVGGRIGDESNQWRLLPLVPRRSQQKETNQRTATAEQRGKLRPTFKQIGSIQMSVNSPSRSPSNLIFFSSLQPVLLRPEKNETNASFHACR